MKMNFGSITNINTNSSNYLKPWDIYKDVKFDGIGDVQTGDTKDGGTWRAWDFSFSCPQGTFKERVFEPKDANRGSYKNDNGHEVELPSSFERILFMAAQLIDAYNPEKKEAFTKYCETTVNKIDDPHKQFDSFMSGLKKILESSTKTAELLLTGRNTDGKIYASLPNFVRINTKTHEAFTSEKFIGHNLTLSVYELGEQAKYKGAKATDMPKVDASGSEDKIPDDQFSDLL